jgi:hypothetical protein
MPGAVFGSRQSRIDRFGTSGQALLDQTKSLLACLDDFVVVVVVVVVVTLLIAAAAAAAAAAVLCFAARI